MNRSWSLPGCGILRIPVEGVSRPITWAGRAEVLADTTLRTPPRAEAAQWLPPTASAGAAEQTSLVCSAPVRNVLLRDGSRRAPRIVGGNTVGEGGDRGAEIRPGSALAGKRLIVRGEAAVRAAGLGDLRRRVTL